MATDQKIRDLLTRSRVVAVVGVSPRPERDSHDVMAFLQSHGYRTIPVNPRAAGSQILGERVVASLSEIEEPVDLVDIFRNSEAAGETVDEAIAIGAGTESYFFSSLFLGAPMGRRPSMAGRNDRSIRSNV